MWFRLTGRLSRPPVFRSPNFSSTAVPTKEEPLDPLLGKGRKRSKTSGGIRERAPEEKVEVSVVGSQKVRGERDRRRRSKCEEETGSVKVEEETSLQTLLILG